MMSGKKFSIIGGMKKFLKINGIINYKRGPKQEPDTIISE